MNSRNLNTKETKIDCIKDKFSTYIKKLVCARPSGILLARRTQGNGITQCQGYPLMSWVSLSVQFVCEENRVPRCNG